MKPVAYPSKPLFATPYESGAKSHPEGIGMVLEWGWNSFAPLFFKVGWNGIGMVLLHFSTSLRKSGLEWAWNSFGMVLLHFF